MEVFLLPAHRTSINFLIDCVAWQSAEGWNFRSLKGSQTGDEKENSNFRLIEVLGRQSRVIDGAISHQQSEQCSVVNAHRGSFVTDLIGTRFRALRRLLLTAIPNIVGVFGVDNEAD
jgi:hypothetical protein